MTDVVRGCLEDAFNDEIIKSIIETKPKIVRVERKNIEKRKE